MVRHGQLQLEVVETVAFVDFIRQEPPQPPSPRQRRETPPPPRSAPPPALPRLAVDAPSSALAPRPPVLEPRLDLDLQLGAGPYLGTMAAPAVPALVSARELTALSTPAPRYPRKARSRRIEGFVEVEFTVDENGDTANIRILAAEPEGVFERSTERAVGHWRFQPHRVNGKAVPIRARQRVDFRLGRR